MSLASQRNTWTHAHGTPTTWCYMASGKSSTCAMGTLCVKRMKFVWMIWSVRSASTPMISSPLPLRRWWGKAYDHHVPTSACIWQSITICQRIKNMSFWFHISKNTKKNNNSKNKLESRFITCLSICRAWWYRHAWVSMEINPFIGRVIYGDNMFTLLEE